jgi:toxin CcdB
MRFDVHPMPQGGRAGYLLDVQADLIPDLATRVVVPLFSDHRLPYVLRDLNPRFDVLGISVVLMTQEIASIQKRLLQRPVASLADHRDEITRALGILLTGF